MSVYNVIYSGAVITGIGWGLVETVINPLTATLYPDEKTARLNVLHAWWPGGLIAGGLLGFGSAPGRYRLAGEARHHLLPALAVVVMCLA